MEKEAKSVKIEFMPLTWFESMRGKWGKEESPPIGEKKREGRKSSFGNPFLPRRGGARYKYPNK